MSPAVQAEAARTAVWLERKSLRNQPHAPKRECPMSALRSYDQADNDNLVGPHLVTIAHAAGLLAVSERTVFKLIAEGALPAVRLGRATRIASTDIVNLIDSHRNRRSPDKDSDVVLISGSPRARRCADLPKDWPRLPYSPRGRRHEARKRNQVG